MKGNMEGSYDRISFHCACCACEGTIENVILGSMRIGLTGRCPECGLRETAWFCLLELQAFADAGDLIPIVYSSPI